VPPAMPPGAHELQGRLRGHQVGSVQLRQVRIRMLRAIRYRGVLQRQVL
jgi:hypothetical protein